MVDYGPEDLAEKTQDHLNKYISAADNKASILLTALFAFLGFSATIINDILNGTSTLFNLFASLGAISGLIAAFLAGLVVYPRTPKPENGFIYWENILEHGERNKFVEAVQDLDGDSALSELSKENYDLAKVAHQKYYYLRWSLRITLLMAVFAVVSMIIYTV
ncbi:Pycsar system effector family protein [Halorubrum sp. CBA1125]|uniref:Pycsar system effector family protein n=1 Tax=Halorubrum sp. CBA1125 TaxID=2668072 RepID=UPI0012E78488|nr:Pycsar system effector family protein [Halorubrum sp. CBA1125]